jgi:hypothetical protein
MTFYVLLVSFFSIIKFKGICLIFINIQTDFFLKRSKYVIS